MNSNKPMAWMQTYTQEYQGVREVRHSVNIERIGINDLPLYSGVYVRQIETENEALKSKSLPSDEIDGLIKKADKEYREYMGASHGYSWCPTWDEWLVHAVLERIHQGITTLNKQGKV